jgi:hypothetical protein
MSPQELAQLRTEINIMRQNAKEEDMIARLAQERSAVLRNCAVKLEQLVDRFEHAAKTVNPLLVPRQ